MAEIQPFEFVSAGRIVFGAGRAREAGAIARALGTRCLLVRGAHIAADALVRSLADTSLDVTEAEGPASEPDVADIDAALPAVRAARPDVIVAAGGGSTLDFAKAIAALSPQKEAAPVRDYLEGVGRGLTIREDPIPLVACPTTAGTGSEVTKNAVISSKAGGFKKSLRDGRMIPAVALVDPDLQEGAPSHVRVWSGLDALTQNIEAYLSRRATPMTRALALSGAGAAGQGLRLLTSGQEREARPWMALAALQSGLALANGGLGAAHGIAQSLGIHGVPHGLACAVALPWVMAWNAGAGAAPAPLYQDIARALCIPGDDPARAIVAWVWELSRALEVSRLTDLPSRWPALPPLDADGLARIARGARGNSLDGNPTPMDDAQVADLLARMRDADGPEALLP